MRARERERLFTADGEVRDIEPVILDVERRLRREPFADDALTALQRLSPDERRVLGMQELGLL